MVPLAWSLALAFQTGGNEPALKIIRTAEHAAVGDSTEMVERRWSAALGRDSSEAQLLLGLGWSAFFTYRYDEANRLLSLAIERAEGPSDVQRWARVGLGDVALWQGDLITAGRLYEDVLVDAEAAGDSVAVVRALDVLASVAARTSGSQAAAPFFERARPWLSQSDPGGYARHICQRAAIDPSITVGDMLEVADRALAAGAYRAPSSCRVAMVQALVNRGQSDSLGNISPSVIARLEEARDDHSLATVLQWIGFYHRLLGGFDHSLDTLQRAVALGDRSGNRLATAWALINLSALAVSFGDVLAGTEQAQRATIMLEEMGDEWGLLTVKGFAGTLWRMAGDYDAARDVYREALDAARRMQQPSQVSALYAALGYTAMLAGAYDEAESAYRSADSVARHNSMTGFVTGADLNLGRLALYRGDLDTAERLVRRWGARELYFSRRSEYFTMLGEVYARRGNIDEAERSLRAAIDTLETLRRVLDERQFRLHVFNFENVNRGVATIIVSLAEAGRMPAAFELTERTRARELLDQLIRADAFAGRDADRSTRPTLSLGEFQESIPDSSTAVLQYLTGQAEPTALLVITRTGARGYRLAPIDSLRTTAHRLAALVETGGDFDAPARRLGRDLLGPALGDLAPEVTNLIVVADDAIHRVPFDVLIGDDAPLIDRYAITSVPSATIAARLWSRDTDLENATMLAIGDPEFPAMTESDDPATTRYHAAFNRSGGLPRLSGARREVRTVARFAEDATVKTGNDATEHFLKTTRLDDYDVVHLATHAVVDARAATRTAIALASGDDQDGFVGPAELAALRLNAGLVVLSGCRTAGGVVVRGEGLQGLTAPLIEAGARSIAATRWRVDDRRIVRIVEDFYRGLAAELPVAEALRSAKLKARSRGEPAALWAAFTVVGDHSVIIPLRTPASAMGPVFIALLAAGVLLVVLRRLFHNQLPTT